MSKIARDESAREAMRDNNSYEAHRLASFAVGFAPAATNDENLFAGK